MNNIKVSELKDLMKRLGLRGYRRLSKAKLIDLITVARNFVPILDETVPEIFDSVLEPTRFFKPILDETVPEIDSEILKPTKYAARGGDASRHIKPRNDEE